MPAISHPLAAASITRATVDASTNTARLILTTHFTTSSGTTATTADEYTSTTHSFIDLPSAAAKFTLAAATIYAPTSHLVTFINCMAYDDSTTTVTSWCLDIKLLPTHIPILHLPRLLIIRFNHSKSHYYTWQYLPTLPSYLLNSHVAAWTASHNTPSSISNGALVILVQSSFTL